MKKIYLVLTLLFIGYSGFSQYQVELNADNNNFTNFTESNSGENAGRFIGASGTTMDVNDKSWGLWANNGSTSASIYEFGGSLIVGDYVEIEISLGSINAGGTVGFALQNSSATNRFEVYYIGHDPIDSFKLNDNEGQENITGVNTEFSSASWNSSNYLTFRFTLLASNTYSLTVNENPVSNTNLNIASSDISQIRIFNYNAGSNYDQFFNNLLISYNNPNIIPSHSNVQINGNVNLATNQNLTINNLTINGGNSLTIKSDASGTGSLIINGSNSGTINFERYIQGYSSSANGWHFLSLPISGLTISSSSFVPTANLDDLFSFDQSTDENQWLNYNGGTFGDTDFQVGKGYLVAYQNTATKTFSGSTIRTTDYTANLSFTSGKPFAGWNLIGNPFTSAIDWDLLTKSASVDGAVYVLGYDGTFKSWNGSAGSLTDGIIPANQGFFVRSTASDQTITMTAGSAGDQLHSSTVFYKSNVELSENTFKIRLSGANGTDETFVQLRDDASNNFDHAIDAFKLGGFGNITEVYTYNDINKFSINCLPMELSSRHVKIGIKSLIEGDHQLHFDGLSDISEQYQLKLEDNLTGSIVDVYDNFTYLFNAEIGDNPNRFLLHFGVVGINESHNLTPAYAYVAGQQLHVVQASGNTTVKVMDVQGRLLHSSSFIADGSYSETLQLPAGVYVVNLTDEAGVRNAKIVVRN